MIEAFSGDSRHPNEMRVYQKIVVLERDLSNQQQLMFKQLLLIATKIIENYYYQYNDKKQSYKSQNGKGIFRLVPRFREITILTAIQTPTLVPKWPYPNSGLPVHTFAGPCLVVFAAGILASASEVACF